MFSKILIPLDGTDEAETALIPAQEIARRFESTVVLVEVTPGYGQIIGATAAESFGASGSVAAAQEVAVAAYQDEAHVEINRALYAAKFDLADQIIGDRYGYRRPAGGFFLWLDVAGQGGGEEVALRLWRQAGLRVLPGRFIARDQPDGSNPGADYIRVAMVQNKDATAEALHRLVAALG